MKVLQFMKGLTFFVLLAFIGMPAFGQEVTITGTVVDEGSNETLIGATIVVKGTTIGTISDIDGNYSLTVNKGETLVFSSIGFVTVDFCKNR